MELSTVIFIGLLVCVVKDVHAGAKRKPLARRLSRMENDMKAWKGTIEAKIDSMRVNIQNTKTRLKAITQQLRRVKRKRNAYRDDLGKVLKELTVTRRDIRALQQDVKQLDTSCGMRKETVPGSTTASTDPSQDPSLNTTVPPVTTQDPDQHASADPSKDRTPSTTVPPVTVTTQDPDQHATPSAAAGRVLYNASRDGDLETVRRIVAAGHVDVNNRVGENSWTPVMAAAGNGHRDVVEFLVGEGADLSLVDELGDNILHVACLGGDLETVKLMLSLNVADINSRGRFSSTPVMMAAVEGNRDVVEFLVGEGADLSLVSRRGYNILHVACGGGHLETVKLVLSLNVVDVNSRGEWDITPVMRAAGNGHRDVVEFLVGEGADPSLVDEWGDNVLHYACGGGDLETVKLIVSLNVADINSRGRFSWTPVMAAARNGHRDVVEFLVGEGADTSLVDRVGNNILHVACGRGDLETVKMMLSLNVADINSRGQLIMTPVMAAAQNGHRDVVEFLVGEGADPSLVDEWGDNVLHYACGGGDLETVKLIVSLNVADINSRGRFSWTPVMAAARNGHRDVVEFLVGEGADTSLVDRVGNNILHVACGRGDLETVKMMLSLNVADINSRGQLIMTPVMAAAQNGHRDVVEFLTGEGADLSLVDEWGNNILHVACLGGHLETVKMMLSLNVADINSRGRWSLTPVMAAAWGGNRDVVEFLVGEGSDPSLVDKNGNNILHWACAGGDLEMVKFLLSLEVADVNARNSGGLTAADVARRGGYPQVVDLLVSRGGTLSSG